MKYTLLELTQAVLSSMDSDEVNSINDTVESQQVVEVIKTVYDDIISRGDLQSNKTLFNLVPSGDITKPVLMTKPEGLDRVEWIKYNRMLVTEVDPLWNEMTFLSPGDFIEYTHNFNPSQSDVGSFDYIADGNVITFAYKNDSSPQYYTTIDDNTIIFDSYDSEVSSTLEASKTLAFGPRATSFVASDDFEPALQPNQFALLLNEAKSLAWAELKQTAHAKAEQSAKRNWRHLQKSRRGIPTGSLYSGGHPFDSFRNFARRR
jgi:hypothetical protein